MLGSCPRDSGSNPLSAILGVIMETVDILGTNYKIIYEEFKDADEDGYCDFTSKEIHLRNDNFNNLGGFDEHIKKSARHEIIHAFMAESGLQSNWEHTQQFGHDETTVDWFAIQFPKIVKVFEELKIM